MSNQPEKLDAIDLQILEVLQSHGRTKRNVLAEKVALSIPAVSERLRKLEERGIIRSFNAVLDAHKIGLEVTAFIFVTAESSTVYPQIIERAAAHEEILECHAITGEGSHLLKVRTQNTLTLEKLLSQIQSWPGVKSTRTSIVLSSPKETTVLPLSHRTKSA
ncbi:MAG: Lrp/AsnC family transcriptional regulator [candidate division KSB1 bacterium]|nr:Lrp/AsnC family transcriptional regulator [candidate division KSB1 bacterium]MDZ7304936.1 Lrp/AsnC family transcriptional regulator [candidate division KSB1 bacterium]MDZ7311654.1 Lrp/AsnC family transcriptional regulator [candidate division KSB1 bacterium]